MTKLSLITAYIQLLRQAWLNPSDGASQRQLHAFEHEHEQVLARYWPPSTPARACGGRPCWNWVVQGPPTKDGHSQILWETLTALRRNAIAYALALLHRQPLLSDTDCHRAWTRLHRAGYRLVRVCYCVGGCR